MGWQGILGCGGWGGTGRVRWGGTGWDGIIHTHAATILTGADCRLGECQCELVAMWSDVRRPVTGWGGKGRDVGEIGWSGPGRDRVVVAIGRAVLLGMDGVMERGWGGIAWAWHGAEGGAGRAGAPHCRLVFARAVGLRCLGGHYALQEYTRMDGCGHVNGQRSARAATRLTAGGKKYEFAISHLAPILLGSA